jgi:hypothetical protein
MITWIWDSSVCDELSEQDSEAPDVRLDRELGVVGGLGSSPLDREPGTHPGNKWKKGVLTLFYSTEFVVESKHVLTGQCML